MEAVIVHQELLDILLRRAREQVDTVAALGEVLRREAEHLHRQDQARRFDCLRDDVMRQVKDIQWAEATAASDFTKDKFVGGALNFMLGSLAAALAGSHEHPLKVGARAAGKAFARTISFGEVRVAVGPGGVPANVKVVALSRMARELDKPESEIIAAFEAQGYRVMTPDAFSYLIEGLKRRMLVEAVVLPLSTARLLPERAAMNSESHASHQRTYEPRRRIAE